MRFTSKQFWSLGARYSCKQYKSNHCGHSNCECWTWRICCTGWKVGRMVDSPSNLWLDGCSVCLLLRWVWCPIRWAGGVFGAVLLPIVWSSWESLRWCWEALPCGIIKGSYIIFSRRKTMLTELAVNISLSLAQFNLYICAIYNCFYFYLCYVFIEFYLGLYMLCVCVYF